ncbi:PTS sugar transporter subunit IIA [Streptococcus massiliensis]|uniref:PTS system, sugar-specific IIA component n=1 Tax=Streptococcus massiliensis TaxID=313439 RepID=A0A380KZS5_9STRE|nr:PTS fructose transporter subunit IIA [Streptococcus massiliensis]SUN76436.1 PTS system, sugar-specific IIA component [Streptococcus massiliensis]
MKYLILVSHGGLAEGVQSSLAMFAGDKTDQVLAAGLQNGKSVDDFAEEFRKVIAPLKAEDSVLVMADIVGGSPLTTALNVLAEKGLLETATVLGGMNLTMALTGLVMKDLLEGKDLVDNILSEATSALQEFSVVADDDEDEDDV